MSMYVYVYNIHICMCICIYVYYDIPLKYISIVCVCVCVCVCVSVCVLCRGHMAATRYFRTLLHLFLLTHFIAHVALRQPNMEEKDGARREG